jgi:hypothetical protein
MLFLVLLVSLYFATPLTASAQKQTDRSITSDDFVKNRPKPRRSKPIGKVSNRYHLASSESEKIDNSTSSIVQLGITIWKFQSSTGADNGLGQSIANNSEWRRVEADTQFREGDQIRLSIESPVDGYLYVVDRDWFRDGNSGETLLIFPTRGEDNRLEAGKLIDIPAENRMPFTAHPKPTQAGELLTIIVTKSPLSLSLLNETQPVSGRQLADWERKWKALNARFEMNGGAGQIRTIQEQEAASRAGSRQLTRDDPPPQTIYYLSPKASDGLLFNLMLSYFR